MSLFKRIFRVQYDWRIRHGSEVDRLESRVSELLAERRHLELGKRDLEAKVAELEKALRKTAVHIEIGQAGCQLVRGNVCQLCRASDYNGPLVHGPGCLLTKEGGA